MWDPRAGWHLGRGAKGWRKVGRGAGNGLAPHSRAPLCSRGSLGQCPGRGTSWHPGPVGIAGKVSHLSPWCLDFPALRAHICPCSEGKRTTSGAVPPRTLLVLFFPRAAPSEHPPSNGWLCSPADHPNPKSQIPPCAPSARLLQHPVAHPSSPHPIPVPCTRLAAHRRCPFLLADCLQPHSKPHGAFQRTPHVLMGPGLAWRVPQGLSPSPFRGGTRTSLSLPREFSGIWGFCVSKGGGEGTWR